MPIELVVELAINECITEGILADFLLQNKAEAIEMSIFEYNQEAHMKCVRQEGYEAGWSEGHAAGHATGHVAGQLQQLVTLVRDGLLPLEVAIQRCGISKREFQEIVDGD